MRSLTHAHVPDADELLRTILSACGDFSAVALKTLSPELVARLDVGLHFVGVRCDPPRARLIVQAPNGETIVVYQADADRFPPALGDATARLLTAGIACLDDRERARVVRLQARGFSLGLLVERELGRAHIVLEAGEGALPIVLVTLDQAPGTLH